MTVTRVDYRHLTIDQKQKYVNALLKYKKEGNPNTGRNYDTLVNWHLQMMQLPMNQMRAHMSPMFLPWHREFLRLLELDLQEVSGDPTLAIPYWDWSDPNAGRQKRKFVERRLYGRQWQSQRSKSHDRSICR
jgi:tyrosinase